MHSSKNKIISIEGKCTRFPKNATKPETIQGHWKNVMKIQIRIQDYSKNSSLFTELRKFKELKKCKEL